MKQLTQTLKDGTMKIIDVPIPNLSPRSVLVKTHYSVISAGTEGKTVSDARKGYIAKAKSRQKEVKQVIDMAKTQGISQTYQMVMNKLDALSPLGYSSAGEVVEVGRDVTELTVGDLVACGGAGANHSEIISVPINLVAKVNESVDLQSAAFSTVGAIAMQGVRQADLRLGENCVVIGLGLIGQLTIQLLNAAGINSIGIDISDKQVELAKEIGAKLALNRNSDGLEEAIKYITQGFGVDAVIITAGTNSTDPVELAGRLARQKGKVIIVGAVPTGFSREQYYKKELDLRMSCSYGPGRYDTDYEENGIDYPIGYVRWTENRNMKAFVDLLRDKKITMDKLITHTFDLQDAPKAYQMIMDKSEPFIGITLKYDVNINIKEFVQLKPKSFNSDDANVAFIGAGSFAQNMLLPNLPSSVNKIAVVTSKGNTAQSVSNKFQFQNALTSSNEIFADDSINTVFITTRHNLHAENVLKCLGNNLNIFVEKPLCLYENELDEIIDLYNQSSSKLMLGYNRRFAPHILELKNRLNDKIPLAINYRINAGYIPKNHWTQDLEIGGGRIIGEVCHFIDLSMFITSSNIVSVYATKLSDSENLNDIINISLVFENGSISNISYFSNGNKKLSKEYIEIFQGGSTYIINDFKEMSIYSNSQKKIKLPRQDKGHKKEMELFITSITNGSPSPISAEDIFHSTLATFKVIESLKTNEKVVFK